MPRTADAIKADWCEAAQDWLTALRRGDMAGAEAAVQRADRALDEWLDSQGQG